MKSTFVFSALLLMLSSLLFISVGCSTNLSDESSLMPVKQNVETLTAGNPYLGFWNVTLISGPAYNSETGTTTFVYEVMSLCEGGKDLSHWVLGLDEDIVVESASVNGEPYPFSGSGLAIDPTTQLFGFKFDDGQPICTTYTYTLEIVGEWCVKDGVFALKAGSNQVPESVAFGTVPVAGECTHEEERFSISGTTFIDVNGNGVFDFAEPVIPNVPILINGGSLTFTDTNGLYTFSGLAADTYTVSVDINSTEGSAPMLVANFTAVTPLSVDVTVGPSAEHVDFGFVLNTGSIELTGLGKTIGFWKHQLNVILTGKGKGQVSECVMSSLVSSVNSFFIADPFSINYVSGLGVLSYSGSNPLDLMLKQLLAAEFNKFYGLGLSDPLLNTIILQTAESYAYYSEIIGADGLLTMKDLLDMMNNLEVIE